MYEAEERGIHRYKFNNSYTIYVNRGYYFEAEKKTREIRRKHHLQQSTFRIRNQHLSPPPSGTYVRSPKYGEGVILRTTKKGTMSVRFGKQIVKYAYPYAFEKRFLTRI